jgi:hypothetical protein
MPKQIKIVQLCLNVVDPYQERMYQYIRQQTNQSAYLRRLVQRDMEGGTTAAPTPRTLEPGDFEAEGFI